MPSVHPAHQGPSLADVLEGVAAELEAGGLESPRTEAERLLALAVRLTRSEVLLSRQSRIGPDEARRLASLVGSRLSGVPLQHLEGTVEFRELDMRADRRALIPRPETEQLVELIARWALRGSSTAGPRRGVVQVPRPGRPHTPPCEVALDIGTGSGAIALSLVHEGIVARAIGLDVSPEALEQARENRRLADLEDRVELRLVRGSLWESVEAGETFDLVVSNPPYVRESEVPGLPREVRDHEPMVALLGGPDGLDVAREVIAGARGRLRAGGALFLEIGDDQGPAVTDELRNAGPWKSVEVLADLSCRDRFVIART